VPEPHISPRARRDLEDIFNFIADHDEAAAERVILKIEKSIRLLGEKPFLGSTLLLPADLALRKVSVPPYLIFYRASEPIVQIVRVLDSSRDLRDPRLFAAN
jgi:toxin ParE1/3/4